MVEVVAILLHLSLIQLLNTMLISKAHQDKKHLLYFTESHFKHLEAGEPKTTHRCHKPGLIGDTVFVIGPSLVIGLVTILQVIDQVIIPLRVVIGQVTIPLAGGLVIIGQVIIGRVTIRLGIGLVITHHGVKDRVIVQGGVHRMMTMDPWKIHPARILSHLHLSWKMDLGGLATLDIVWLLVNKWLVFFSLFG